MGRQTIFDWNASLTIVFSFFPQFPVWILPQDVAFGTGGGVVPLPAAGWPGDSDHAALWTGLPPLPRRWVWSPWLFQEGGGRGLAQAVQQNPEELLWRWGWWRWWWLVNMLYQGVDQTTWVFPVWGLHYGNLLSGWWLEVCLCVQVSVWECVDVHYSCCGDIHLFPLSDLGTRLPYGDIMLVLII